MMIAWEEESAGSLHKPAKAPKIFEAEDTEPSLSKTSVNNELESDHNSHQITQSDSESSVSDGDWADMLKTFDNEEYFDALSDISDENADSDMEDDNEVTDEKEAANLGFEVGLWASSFGSSFVALSALLALLRLYHLLLPKDPRTLLRTPRQSMVRQIACGAYFHFGVMKALSQSKKLLDYLVLSLQACFLQLPNILLQVNVDGLPLFKSASTQFWPILGRVCSPVLTDPFMIGLFCGEQKPANLDGYFQDFVQEMLTFKLGPVDFPVDSHHIPVNINLSCFICHAPARAFVKEAKGHTGYHGCEKCIQRGTWAGKMTFSDIDAELRTDESFKWGRENNDLHHIGPVASPLLRCLDVKMVTQFPLDYMHMVCRGVTRRLTVLAKESSE